MHFLFPRTLTRTQYALRLLTLLILVWTCLALGLLIALSLSLLPSWQTKQLSISELVPLLVLMAAPLLLALSRFSCLDVPRLRSIGCSPWLVLLFLVPVVNFILQICLFAIAPRLDYTDEKQEGRRPPELRVLAWVVSIFVVLVIANAVFLKHFLTPPVDHRGAIATGLDTAHTEAGSDSAKMVTSDLHVDSIFFQNSARSSAVVNNNSVMVDDHVGKWVITTISSNSVTFRNADGETSIVQVK